MGRLSLIALVSFHLLIAAQKRNGKDLAREAVEAERRGDFAAAISAFKELLAGGAESPELRSNLGMLTFNCATFTMLWASSIARLLKSRTRSRQISSPVYLCLACGNRNGRCRS